MADPRVAKDAQRRRTMVEARMAAKLDAWLPARRAGVPPPRIARPALTLLAVFMILTGVVYPLVVTAFAQIAFPHQANGSLLVDARGRVVGSRLIGQPFTSARYFWSRPSATAGQPYNASVSGGSNLAPSNPELVRRVRERIAALSAAGSRGAAKVPVDLVTASGSGLDPDISPAAALYQAPRVARARGLSKQVVRALVMKQVRERTLGLFGEPTVNVLELNLTLDARR